MRSLPTWLSAAALLVAGCIDATPTRTLPLTVELDQRQAANGTGYHWVSTWTAVTQLIEPSNLPPSPYAGTDVVFKNATFRETLRVSIGTSRIRIQVSNFFGGSALPITAASIAVTDPQKGGVPNFDQKTLRGLTFNGGSQSVTLAKGQILYTDPIDYNVAAGSILSVSFYLKEGQSGKSITGHSSSRTASFFAPGNQINNTILLGGAAAGPGAAGVTNGTHWYFTAAIEAWVPQNNKGFVILGDSITDGRGSTDNMNNRWPDQLYDRMVAAKINNVAINNEAAGGNAVVAGGLGPALLTRYKRDAIQQSGAKYVMIFEGVNDIGTSSGTTIGDKLIDAYKQIAADCKAAGLKVFGATITPFGGQGQSYYTPTRESVRLRVNQWILTSGTFDATVDFAKAAADPKNATILNPAYDSGDHLHMNPAGYKALADAVPLSLFS